MPQKLLIFSSLRQESCKPSHLEVKKRILLVAQKKKTNVGSSLSTNTEIIWALKSIMSSYSNNSCANMNDTFKRMFPDSKVAEEFSMIKSKVSYIVNHRLAPYFKTILKDEITKFDCYIVSFDGNLNDITQTCQMDLLVSYWDVEILDISLFWSFCIF